MYVCVICKVMNVTLLQWIHRDLKWGEIAIKEKAREWIRREECGLSMEGRREGPKVEGEGGERKRKKVPTWPRAWGEWRRERN